MAAMGPFRAVDQWGRWPKASSVCHLFEIVFNFSAQYNGSCGDSGQVFAKSGAIARVVIFRLCGVRMMG
ncbi:MAG: hypothetical protein B7X12_01105 [Halothiobacillus sp. 20-53-49]|nr:MAG: hypothetical protein B7X12_01105 [Halothiobacillus sp. 20-53-49]